MPFANFKIPQGMMTAAQKADLIHRTTDLLVSYFGEGARAHTMVLVDEVVDGGYGRADAVFDLEALRRMQARLEPRSR
ncbi:4-oxalocrotonate tautomerase [Methylobacterium sp. OAE515]|jgi:4-oxalocrotonate tautomerase|uniref:tautomerase family protein n=1 Tax=Methylobacterium sp. OAE515 TaxID=2817895 RepID=UPI00178BABFB